MGVGLLRGCPRVGVSTWWVHPWEFEFPMVGGCILVVAPSPPSPPPWPMGPRPTPLSRCSDETLHVLVARVCVDPGGPAVPGHSGDSGALAAPAPPRDLVHLGGAVWADVLHPVPRGPPAPLPSRTRTPCGPPASWGGGTWGPHRALQLLGSSRWCPPDCDYRWGLGLRGHARLLGRAHGRGAGCPPRPHPAAAHRGGGDGPVREGLQAASTPPGRHGPQAQRRGALHLCSPAERDE